MATNTYVALDTKTITSNVTDITFTGINQGYTDLILVVSGICDAGANSSFLVQFNGDAGSNYSRTYMYGDGTSAVSGRDANQTNGLNLITMDPTTRTNNIIQINNYSSTTIFKTALSRLNNTNNVTAAIVGLWRSTAAITSIKIFNTVPRNIVSGSTFTLYGIANADIGALATGGIITYDANYYYHTFGANGTFTPKQALTCDYLIVAGGGAGGPYNGGGGGGGGGYISGTGSFSATGYSVTVGAGGATATAKGGDSIFNSLTATGGGGGAGGGTVAAGTTGGSGGGGGGNGTYSAGYAASPSGQGNNGGNGYYDGGSTRRGGGGGGATSVGVNATSSSNGAGNGGTGLSSSIIGTATVYSAGGGGGGHGADSAAGLGTSGVSGNGGSTAANATNGTVNTGGGGGGGGGDRNVTGLGGSGVVIIRYPKG